MRCQLCPSMLGLQWHHIVRRSATGGPVDWIAVDGLVLWNKLRVCIHCHERINNHGIRLWYEDGEGWSVWVSIAYPLNTDQPGWWQHPKSGTWFARIMTIKEVRGVQ